MAGTRLLALHLAVLLPAMLGGCGRAPAADPPMALRYAKDRCGGASPQWGPHGIETGDLVSYNRIDVDGVRISWNGAPIGQLTLRHTLALIPAAGLHPPTVLVATPVADCATVADVRAVMNTILHCSSDRRCTEYGWQDWLDRHPPPPPPPSPGIRAKR